MESAFLALCVIGGGLGLLLAVHAVVTAIAAVLGIELNKVELQ